MIPERIDPARMLASARGFRRETAPSRERIPCITNDIERDVATRRRGQRRETDPPPDHSAPLQSVISEAKAREISGHDVFDDGPAARAPQMSELKASHLQGHDVFDDAPDRAYVPGRELSDAKFERDFKGHDVFSDSATPRRPGTALSGAKAAEIRGQDIFSDGPGYVAAEMSDARAAAVAAMHGQDVFADGTVERRTTVAVTNPNRNSSNVTF